MRNIQFAENEYYHICGRGLDKKTLFHDDRDWARFLFLILYFQSPTKVNNISSYISSFLKKDYFSLSQKKQDKMTKERSVELISFALMPNHFHLLLRNLSPQALSAYMQRILMAYGKYFNAKYERFGHVFDGPFRGILIQNNTQLLHASAYIHKNPIEVSDSSYQDYKWSSCQDYLKENRWGDLLKQNIILEQFQNKSKYKNFLDTSSAKESDRAFDF